MTTAASSIRTRPVMSSIPWKRSIGHSVDEIEGSDPFDFLDGLEGKDILVIPELERASSSEIQDLADDVGAIIRGFVAAGGKLIIHGTRNGKAAEFLNEVFEADGVTGLVEASTGTSGSGEIMKADDAVGTVFNMGPDSLIENSRVSGLRIDTLPPTAKNAYETDSGGSTYSVVTQIPIGMGKITYLGWDWKRCPAGRHPGRRLVRDPRARHARHHDVGRQGLDLRRALQGRGRRHRRLRVDHQDQAPPSPTSMVRTPSTSSGPTTARRSRTATRSASSTARAWATAPSSPPASVEGNMLTLEFEGDYRIQKIELSELGLDLPQHRHGEFKIDYEVMTAETHPMHEEVKEGGETATLEGSFDFIVGAVADKPTIELPEDVGPQFKQFEFEDEDESGENDTGATAQNLGTLASSGDQVSVGGWISLEDNNDIDFYCFTLEGNATVYFDIDMGNFGGLKNFDAQLSLFTADGSQLATPFSASPNPVDAGADDDSAPFADDIDDPIGFVGFDPFFATDLNAGTYYVAVTAWNNDPDFDGVSGSAGTSNGDYMLQVRTQLDDIPTEVDVLPLELSFDGPLEKLGTETLVHPDRVPGNQGHQDIAALPDGGYVVAWVEKAGGPDDDDTVWFQIFDADGVPEHASSFQVTGIMHSGTQRVDVASLSDGRFVISYLSDDADAFGAYSQIFNGDGTLDVGPYRINDFEGTDSGMVDGFQNFPDAVELLGSNAGTIAYVYQSSLQESGQHRGGYLPPLLRHRHGHLQRPRRQDQRHQCGAGGQRPSHSRDRRSEQRWLGGHLADRGRRRRLRNSW